LRDWWSTWWSTFVALLLISVGISLLIIGVLEDLP